MLCVPVVSVAIENVAVPVPSSVLVPSCVAASINFTDPVAVPEAEGCTTAVKVTL